jgi:predicted nucleic acid-binding protein
VITYVDSSVLVSIYVPEQFSKAGRRVIEAAGQIPFNELHQLEVRNAFELLVGRALITRVECAAILAHLREDIDHQRLIPTALDLDRVFADAGDLSMQYTSRFLSRTLDLLHVAAARVSACTTFVSADDRQLDVARATGMRTIDVKRPRAIARASKKP